MSTDRQGLSSGDSLHDAPPCARLSGTLHVHVAFDIGGEVNLERARQLVPAESQTLPRRPRTPSSIAYRPPPLRFRLPSTRFALAEFGETEFTIEAHALRFRRRQRGVTDIARPDSRGTRAIGSGVGRARGPGPRRAPGLCAGVRDLAAGDSSAALERSDRRIFRLSIPAGQSAAATGGLARTSRCVGGRACTT